MYYALFLIIGGTLGMIINALLISGAREDERTQHLIELQKEYERGYRQAKFEQQTELNMWLGNVNDDKA